MPKAKVIDRLELTRKKMQAREAMKQSQRNPAHEVIASYDALIDAAKKANSAFLKMRDETLKENPSLDDFHRCPLCGGELARVESCYRCKKCGWSKC